ncbi:hypothetical protein EJ05DRAFT_479469 [Pseudovirgaria hyperparasitica]|uniref:Ubiquitin-like protease family profile domain-containing protein n=1 Tax=Pseudovirgaria hyperparasitica TaxID=470096 RepID=A0A6A6VV96_9PEZI|nr:uncharacterized protein EJ05DRAFT_479469 [Pseudovirgaria hyperparasitica]KAF2754492.1 hypothetical protein EJ05DRAFT_479469 [Pseudovirgaria hyperparasitica]
MHLPPHLRHPREPKPVDTSLLSMLGSDLQSSPYQASILRDRSPRTAAQDDSVVEVARASLGGWGLGTSTTTTNRPSRPSDLDLSGFISNPADPPSKEDIDALEPSESFCRSVIDARAAKASDEAVREIIEDLCLEYACNDIKRHVKDSQFLTTPAQESRMIKERQAELIRYAVEKLPLARQRAQKAMEPERSSLTATEAADQMHHRIAMEAITMAMHKYAAINDEDIHFQESTMLQDSRLFNDSTMFEGNESTAFGNSTIIEGSSMMPASFLEDTVDGPSAFDQATTHEESTIIGGVSKLSAPAVEEHSDHLSELIEEATARDTSTFVNESSMMPASDFDAYEHDSTAEDSTFGPSDDFLANESSFVHGPEPENVNSDDIDQTNVSSFEHLPRTFRHTLPQISDDPDSNDDSDENDDDHHHDEKNQVTIISDSDDSSSVNGAGSEAESQSEGESEEGSEESAQYSDQESDTASDGLEPPSDQVIIDIPPSLTAVIDAAVSNGVSSVTTRTANFTDAALARIVPNLFPARGAAGGSSAWLNDDSIDDFLALLVKHSNEKQGFNPDDRAATSVPPLVAFSSKWHEVIKAKGYTGVQRWSRRAKVSEKRLLKAKMVFFPINQGGSHWTLLVINVSERTIEFLDSLGGTGGAVLGMARKWLEGELGEEYAAADWADVTLRSGQQHNSSDCGVFTCMNALAIARGDVPREVVVGSRMGAARQQLAATLLVGSFSGVLAW